MRKTLARKGALHDNHRRSGDSRSDHYPDSLPSVMPDELEKVRRLSPLSTYGSLKGIRTDDFAPSSRRERLPNTGDRGTCSHAVVSTGGPLVAWPVGFSLVRPGGDAVFHESDRAVNHPHVDTAGRIAIARFFGQPPPAFVVKIKIVPQGGRRVARAESTQASITVVPPEIPMRVGRMKTGGHQPRQF